MSFSCNVCFKSFARKGNLTRHEALHTGIKPHVCETCGKGFAQFSGLKTHRNVHSKDRPYICGIGTCTKAFGDPSSRARHRKETHRREGAYKCIVPECGTRIKRRSAFVGHLRKHGLDPSLVDLDAIVLQNSEAISSTPIPFTSPTVENQCQYEAESRSASPPFLGDTGPGPHTLSDRGVATHFLNNNGWSGDNSFDCHRASWSNSALFSGSVFDQAMNMDSGVLPETYPHSFQSPFCLDSILPATVDYPLLAGGSHFKVPVLEPFLEAGFLSSSSSPSSTYSALCTTGFTGDDMYNVIHEASEEELHLAPRSLQEPS